jgi:aryl-alcohol dehydrogenase-like predicted oxidoreductase
MIARRKFLGIAAGAGASLALTPELLRALQPFQQSGGKLIQRAIPSTGEMLPVISFDPQKESDNAGMKEILRTLLDNGGKVIDFPHGGGEEVARTAAGELGIQDKFFWTTPLSVPPLDVGPVLPGAIRKVDPAAVRTALEAKLAKFKVPRIDLVMVSASSDVPTCVAVLREMKKEGKVRYIGVHDLTPPPYPTNAVFARLESIMRNEAIDFVGTDYSAGWRSVEERILPLAMERKIGFMAHFAFDRGRLFQRASGTPLPEWAAEFDAKTWAQFFLKYVISHPAVIVARTGTTKPAHMLDNIGGGIGRLPNEVMRKRMAAFVDALPARATPAAASSAAGRTVITPEQVQQQLANQPATAVVLSAAIPDRYAGEYRHVAAGTTATIRRDGDKLLVNVQDSGRPEISFVARAETRFVSGPFTLEFQLDGQGKVTGATWETAAPPGMAPQRIPLERR